MNPFVDPAEALRRFRGASLENAHRAHIVVVDHDGTPLLGFGHTQRMTLARSAAKPAQALAVLETGAMERFGFDDADLALMCASHNSEERHITRASTMLAKLGCLEADLRCGGHAPLSAQVQQDWIRRGFTPTSLCSNCSGKHVGMLGAALALGTAIEDYHQEQHPVQLRVKQVMAQAVGLSPSEVEWAIDGCNLPTPAFPLDRLAYLYASLADAADRIGQADLLHSRHQLGADERTPRSDAPSHRQGSHPKTDLTPRTQRLAQIFRAMTQYPELVAGEERFCTLLMRAFEGAVVGKLGADACYGVGIQACEQTRRLGAKGAVGVAIKVEDGNVEALYMLVSEVLHRLEIGTPEQRAALDAIRQPKMLNTRGVEVGHVEYPFVLRGLPVSRHTA